MVKGCYCKSVLVKEHGEYYLEEDTEMPQSEEEMIAFMKTNKFLEYCEDRGILIRFDDENKRVQVIKTEKFVDDDDPDD